jgi:quinol monooxygenase YgiN
VSGENGARAIIVTRMRVHPEQLDRSLAVFADMQADVHANEPGTVFYQYYQADDDATVFWVHEVFANEAAKQHHLGNHGHRRADFDEILAQPPEFFMVHEI